MTTTFAFDPADTERFYVRLEADPQRLIAHWACCGGRCDDTHTASYPAADCAARSARLARELSAAMRGRGIEAVVAERMSFPSRSSHASTASISLGWGVLTRIEEEP